MALLKYFSEARSDDLFLKILKIAPAKNSPAYDPKPPGEETFVPMTWNVSCMKVTMSIDQIWHRQCNLTFLTLILWANSSFFQWNFSNAAVTSLLRHLLIFIRPESNHCLPLSLTDSPTHSICLVDLSRLLLLLMLMLGNVLRTVWCSFWSWSYKIKFLFRLWAQSSAKICVRTCDMTSRIHFGKQNSTLGCFILDLSHISIDRSSLWINLYNRVLKM